MKRPIKSQYISGNQVFYSEELQKYHEDLEKYVNHLEQLPTLTDDLLMEIILTKFHGHTRHQWITELSKKYPYCEIPHLIRGVWNTAQGREWFENQKQPEANQNCVNCGRPMYDSFSGTPHNSETCQNQRPATALNFENA